MFHFSSFKKNIDSLLAAAGFFIIFLFTRHGGIGIEPDGVVFSTAAENFRVSGTLAGYMHNPVVEFPAFYPTFLSGLMLLTGIKPLVFAPVLNALLFAVIIYLSGHITEQFSLHSKMVQKISTELYCIKSVFTGSLFDAMDGNNFYAVAATFYAGNAPLF